MGPNRIFVEGRLTPTGAWSWWLESFIHQISQCACLTIRTSSVLFRLVSRGRALATERLFWITQHQTKHTHTPHHHHHQPKHTTTATTQTHTTTRLTATNYISWTTFQHGTSRPLDATTTLRSPRQTHQEGTPVSTVVLCGCSLTTPTNRTYNAQAPSPATRVLALNGPTGTCERCGAWTTPRIGPCALQRDVQNRVDTVICPSQPTLIWVSKSGVFINASNASLILLKCSVQNWKLKSVRSACLSGCHALAHARYTARTSSRDAVEETPKHFKCVHCNKEIHRTAVD